jgi:sugar/nucleoside kinase (ribokinase family)
MEHAIGIARAAGRKVAVTPSDIACIERQGDRFRALIAAGLVDMLFLNEAELAALGGSPAGVELLVVTRGEEGATAIRGGEQVSVPALRTAPVVDTTGAGDLFAAGFLFGHARGLDLGEALRIGTVAAAEVIGHFGARPVADLKALIRRFT